MIARAALADAAARLPGDTPRLDAELLLAHLLGTDRAGLLLRRLGDALDADAWAALVARRMTGEPVAYIVGEREFWSLPFRVTPAVLIPRPDSETLVEAALAHAPEAPSVLDLGTGSGCLLLATLSERPAGWGVGVDRSPAAAAVAADNARRLGLAERASIVVGDWGSALDARFDVVLSNPPYIEAGEALPRDVAEHEPHAALFAGADGLDAYRTLMPRLPSLLRPGGRAHLEIGATQADLVIELAHRAGLGAEARHDLAGRPRCVTMYATN
jgi:release factor glutamine methyltransferase